MPKYQPIDLIGGFYTDDSLSWSAQDTVNWLPLAAEVSGTRTVTKLRTPPGLLLYSTMDPDPVRGSHNVEGRLFSVAGTTLYEIALGGGTTNRGVIPGVERVSMAHNQITFGNQLTTVNGDSGYVFNTVTNTLTKITDPGFEGSIQTDFLDGYMLHVDPFGRFWFHSALADALSFSTLDRYQSEASPDKIVGLKAFQSEVVVFNDSTIEFFVNVGGPEGSTFENKQIVINRGCASRHSIQRINNTLVWLGEDGAVYALNGYREQRISTVPIEQAIAGLNWSQAFATVWEDQGHTVYYLTFPDGRTWGYDFTSGLWTRRESYEMDRWRINTLTFWQGIWIAGDFLTGILYELAWGTYHENGQHLISERSSGYSHSDQNRVQCPYLELMFDTGVGIVPVLSVSGDLPNGFIGTAGVYQYSANGGFAPYTFAISAGSLPPGTSMSSSGLVTYNYSTAGSFSWTVQVTDAFGQTATVNDTAQVTAVEWWITEAVTSSVWDTGDITAPGPMKIRSPSNATLRGAQQVGTTVFFMGSTATWNKAPAAAYPGNIPTTNTTVVGVDSAVFASGDISTVKGVAGSYSITIDGGNTWQAVLDSGGLITHLPYRLSSGRWISYREQGATFNLYYSDESIPVNWILGQHPVNSITNGDVMATNGSVLCVPVGGTDPDGLMRTTDGDTYTLQTIPSTSPGQWTCGIGVGDHFIFTTAQGQTIVSHDAGLTWASVSIIANLAVVRLEYANGVYVASGTNSVSGQPGIAYSVSNGDTWTGVARPAGAGAGSRLAAGPISYIP